MSLINFLALDCAEFASSDIGGVIRTVYNAIRIGVPIILIIVGMVGMGKAIAQQKEDEIKKAQSTLVKQAVAALIVFLLLSGVKLLVGVVGGTETEKSCIDQLLNGNGTTENANGGNGGSATKSKREQCQDGGGTWDAENGVCN